MNLIIRKRRVIENLLFFFFGVIATMPILQIAGFSLFTLYALVMAVYVMFWIYCKKIAFWEKMGNVWYIFVVLSSLVSIALCLTSDMPSFWKSNQYTNIVWCIVFLLLIFYFSSNEGRHNAHFFLQGVYFAAIFQMLWGLLQRLCYEMFGLSINDVFFSEVFQFTDEATHLKYNGEISLSGFCSHVANMTPLVTLAYVLTNNIYVKALCCVFAVLCNSRTTLIGILVCVCFDIISYIRKQNNNLKKRIFGFGTIAVGGFLCVFLEKIVSIVQKVIDMFRFQTIDTSALTHLNYWIMNPDLFTKVELKNIMFGFGMDNSGYPFSHWYSQYDGANWIVECDYVNQLWNTGIIGLILTYGWWLYVLNRCRKSNSRYAILMTVFLVEGITYNVMFKWTWIVLFAIYGLISTQKNVADENIYTDNIKRMTQNG